MCTAGLCAAKLTPLTLCAPHPGLQVALSRYKRWSTPPQLRATQSKRPRQELLDQKLLPVFKNGRNLRDYQVSSAHASAQWAVMAMVHAAVN